MRPDWRPESPMMKVQRLRGIDLGVPDPEATARFYTDIWGLARATTVGRSIYLRGTGPDHHILALHPAATPRVLRIDLLAETERAVLGLRDQLYSAGVKQLELPAPIQEPGEGFGFSFLDFEGRTIRILTCLPQATSEASIDRPIALTHVLLDSVDKNRIIDLYSTALGFRVIDHMHSSTFLNCNADHHTIGISGGGAVSSLHHVAFEMCNLDAVMRGAGRLRSHGHSVDWGVGRHGPGNNVYAYFVGLNQEIIEYSAEMAQVDDTYIVRDSDYWVAQHPKGWTDHWGLGEPTPRFLAARRKLPFSSPVIFHP